MEQESDMITQKELDELVRLSQRIKESFRVDAECHKAARKIINLPDGVDDYTKGGWIVTEAAQRRNPEKIIRDLLKANKIEVKKNV